MNLNEVKPGMRVVYNEKEEGYVTSKNEKYVFVRYGSDGHSKATNPKDLTKI
jgi:hypothetical protein